MEIRKAKKKNFKEIAKIYMNEFSKPPYDEPWTFKKAINKIKLFSKYCDIWEILVDNEIIGFIVVNSNQWCPGEVAFAEDIAIKKEYQRKSIGTKVVKEIFSIYKKKGFKEFMAIGNRKSKALKLWSSLGFKESKENVLIKRKLK